jgi:hypothetical protein
MIKSKPAEAREPLRSREIVGINSPPPRRSTASAGTHFIPTSALGSGKGGVAVKTVPMSCF